MFSKTVAWFLSIDGGGTATRARLRGPEGTIVAERQAGPANADRDLAAAVVTIRTLCAQTLAGIGSARDVVLGIGLSGAGGACRRSDIRRHFHDFAHVTVATDAYAAWYGAFEGEDGGVILTGTGSCGLARKNDTWHFVGGWGLAVSDDAGGAKLGVEALRATLQVHDGLRAATPLTRLLLQRFGGSPQSIVDFCRTGAPADYAAIAPLVVDHAGDGDRIALSLLQGAADHAEAIAARFLALGVTRLSLCGGLAETLTPRFSDPVVRHLQPPQYDPLDGAFLIARAAWHSRPVPEPLP